MTSSNVLFLQQSPLDKTLPGCWKLGSGRAVSLRPREDGVLRLAHGRVWVTIDGPASGLRTDLGDHFLGAGEQITLQAGQRAVIESWAPDGQAPAYFHWDPLPALLRSEPRMISRWQLAVLQPLTDLRLALGLGVGAAVRLLGGLAGFAIDLVAPRVRFPWAEHAFNAQSKACRAHGAMS